jgi:hypothetical protein
MNKEREDLVKELTKLQEKEKEIKNQINIFDFDEKLEKNKAFLGKYFQEISTNDEYVRCLFVYNIDIKTGEPQSICVSYWKNQDDFFEISGFNQFNPNYWEDDADNWILINKDIFDKHYEEVLKRINKSLKNKTK